MKQKTKSFQNQFNKQKLTKSVGLLILCASLLFMIYSLRCFDPDFVIKRYSINLGLIVAAISFSQLIFAFVGRIKAKKNGDYFVEVLKMINLTSAIISISLAQSAIMSFTHTDGNLEFYSGLSGVFFSSISALIGLYMLLKKKY